MATQTRLAAAATSVTMPDSSFSWSDTGNVFADDGSFASATSDGNGFVSSEALTVSDFGFSLPSSAKINFIQVEIKAKASAGTTPFYVRRASLAWDGLLAGVNRAFEDQDTYSTTWRTVTFGSSGEYNWGLPLIPDAINDSRFGFGLVFFRDGSSVLSIQVDYIKITVDYDESGGRGAYDSAGDTAVGVFSFLSGQASANIVFPLMGTPKAATFFTSPTVQKLNVQEQPSVDGNFTENFLRYSFGAATSATDRWCATTRISENGCIRVASSDCVIKNVFSSSVDVFYTSDIVGFSADKIELSDLDTVESNSPYVVVQAWTGSAVEADCGVINGGDGTTGDVDSLSIGFEPSAVICGSLMEIASGSLTHQEYAGTGVGFCANPGGGNGSLVQRAVTWQVRQSDNQVRHRVSEGLIHWHHNPQEVETYTAQLQNFSSSGFEVLWGGDNGEGGGTGPDDGLGWLAIKTPQSAAVFTMDTPTATGAQGIGDSRLSPNIDGTPVSLMLSGGLAESVDTEYQNAANAEHTFFGFADSLSQSQGSAYNENASDPRSITGKFSLQLTDSASSSVFDASLSSFDEGGFTLDASAFDATSRKWAGIAFLETTSSGTTIDAVGGSFSLTGGEVDLTVQRQLSGNPGTFSLTGSDVTLTYAPVASFQLDADPGVFTFTGGEVLLTVQRALQADAGSYTLTGSDVELSTGLAFTANSGTFSLTGGDVTFSRGYALSLEPGEFTITGSTVNLSYSGEARVHTINGILITGTSVNGI